MAIIFTTACSQKANTTAFDDGSALFNADSLKQYVSVLASDSFMGRKPFTEGETRTISYLQQQFKAVGLEPGNGSSYIQVQLHHSQQKPVQLCRVRCWHLFYRSR